jgi:UDP-N-acetylglucosamine 2-epimerase (non-hydrolysing)
VTFWLSIGTAAELIKMLPILDEAERRGIDWYLLSTGQSGVNLWRQYADFALPERRIVRLLESDADLASSWVALKWFARAFFRPRHSLRRRLLRATGKAPAPGDFWFVHGDTLSTLLGALYARRLGIPVVHVEAGMRSHDIFSPFPEEISRRLVSRLATYHMAPDDHAAENLRREGIVDNVIVTGGNTVLDALAVALRRFPARDVPAGDYAVANIHRFENLNSPARWNKIIDVLVEAAKQIPIRLVMMPNTIAKLEEDRAARARLESAGITLSPRLPFSQFVHFMHGAKFMLTDGGSNQQECYHLGLPCLILREKTESIEGIGGCCVLSRMDDSIVREFLREPQKFRRDPPALNRRPTDIIYDAILGPA